jgi:RNA-directed DNA polymerase
MHGSWRGERRQRRFPTRLIQCGTREHAEQALVWARARLAALGLRLHPEKTRIVEDREGFDFLGFHHRRVDRLRRTRRASHGVLRWPSKKAQQRFRDRIRRLVGPPLRLREDWSECVVALRKYLVGYCQYYRHGHSSHVFRRLDYYVECRISRNYARSQPTGKGRKPRNWLRHLEQLREWGKLPKLEQLQKGAFRAYRSEGKVRWRAV